MAGLEVRRVVAVGAVAEAAIRRAIGNGGTPGAPSIARIPHPSPASPAAHHDWAGQVDAALAAAGIDLGQPSRPGDPEGVSGRTDERPLIVADETAQQLLLPGLEVLEAEAAARRQGVGARRKLGVLPADPDIGAELLARAGEVERDPAVGAHGRHVFERHIDPEHAQIAETPVAVAESAREGAGGDERNPHPAGERLPDTGSGLLLGSGDVGRDQRRDAPQVVGVDAQKAQPAAARQSGRTLGSASRSPR